MVLSRQAWGDAARRVLLLHGSTSSSATGWQVGPALADQGWVVVAPDLPSHGASPRAALVPTVAAAAAAASVGDQPFDLVVGHPWGAAVAVALVAGSPYVAQRVVLEELPGADSVAWQDEAAAVLADAQDARRDLAAAVARTRAGQPRWASRTAGTPHRAWPGAATKMLPTASCSAVHGRRPPCSRRWRHRSC